MRYSNGLVGVYRMNQEDFWDPIGMLAKILAINGVSGFLSAARGKTASPSPERDDWHVLLTAIEGVDGECLGSAIDSARPVIINLQALEGRSAALLRSEEMLRNDWCESVQHLQKLCAVVVPWAEEREKDKYRGNDGSIHPASAIILRGQQWLKGWRRTLDEQQSEEGWEQRDWFVKTIQGLSQLIREGYADESLPEGLSVYEFDTEAKRIFTIGDRLSVCEKDLDLLRAEQKVLQSEYQGKVGELLYLLAALPPDALLAIRRVMVKAPQV